MRQSVIALDTGKAFDIGILLRLSWLNERDLDVVPDSLSMVRLADVFRTVVALDYTGLSAPFDL